MTTTSNVQRTLTPNAAATLLVPKLLAEDGQAGIIIPTDRGWGPGVANLSTANLARFIRFCPRRDITPLSVAFVSGVVSTNNESVEIWISDASGTKLFTTGAVAGLTNSAIGVKNPAFVTPTLLTAGTVYYAALTSSLAGGTAPQLVTAAFQDVNTAKLFGTALGVVRFGTMAAVVPGSAPTTLVPDATTASAQQLYLALRD